MVQLSDTNTQTTAVLSKVADLSKVVDSAAVGNVFGQPVTQGDVTVIPVAKVVRGFGGGSGTGTEDGAQGEGGGGALAVAAKPVGVFVIKGGEVSWRPAVDVNRVILGGQLVAMVAVLAIRGILKAKARAAAQS